MILVDGTRTDSISALDRGLAYGDGVFRTMRAEVGRIVLWPLHYAKLRTDCARLGIECPLEATLLDDVGEVLRAAPECVVKIIVTRGQGGRGYAAPIAPKPTRIVADFPLPPSPVDCDDRDVRGVRARWCNTRLSIQPALAGIKHLNRLENVLARQEWSDASVAEGLMLDPAGYVIEGTATNVFILESDRLATPSLDGCGVAGVQRDRVLALAPRYFRACEVDTLTPQRLLAADQVYLVNSVIGLWWIGELGERTWQRCDVTLDLLQALRQALP